MEKTPETSNRLRGGKRANPAGSPKLKGSKEAVSSSRTKLTPPNEFRRVSEAWERDERAPVSKKVMAKKRGNFLIGVFIININRNFKGSLQFRNGEAFKIWILGNRSWRKEGLIFQIRSLNILGSGFSLVTPPPMVAVPKENFPNCCHPSFWLKQGGFCH
jgi:hypothetical protein